jgi:hypothetical protein
MGWYKVNYGELGNTLMSLRPQLANAAQTIYNQWEQDPNGLDAHFGGGGICDEVSRAMADVVCLIPGVELTEGGQPGDDHATLIVYNESEAYEVDIPPGVYETGGGYSWKKIPNVVIEPNDVLIAPIERQSIETSEY